MVGEKTSGALSMAIGGVILVLTIELPVVSGYSLGTQGLDLVPGVGIPEFLAFLLIGYGLFSVIREATSTSRR